MKRKPIILKYKGNGLYVDERERQFIRDRKENVAYLLYKEEQKKAILYQNRYALPIAILVIVGFLFDWILAIIISVISFAILQYLYTKRFLPSLECFDKVEFSNKSTKEEKINSRSILMNIAQCVAFVAIPILLYFNFKDMVSTFKIEEIFKNINDSILFIVSIAITLFCIYNLFFTLKVIVLQIQNKENT